MRRRSFVWRRVCRLGVGCSGGASQRHGGDIPMRGLRQDRSEAHLHCPGRSKNGPAIPTWKRPVSTCATSIDLGINYFDCAHGYWGGKSEEVYGGVLPEFRKHVFITTKSMKRTRKTRGAGPGKASLSEPQDPTTSTCGRCHDVRTQHDIDQIFGPDGALRGIRGGQESGAKCRFIGLHRHFDPQDSPHDAAEIR